MGGIFTIPSHGRFMRWIPPSSLPRRVPSGQAVVGLPLSAPGTAREAGAAARVPPSYLA